MLYAAEIEVDNAKLKSQSNGKGVGLLDWFDCLLCGIDEQKGTVEYDREGERITVNFEQKLEVKSPISS